MTAPPNQPSYPPGNWTPAHRKPRKGLVIAIVSAVVAIAIAVTLALAFTGSSKPKTFTLHGSMTVLCSASYSSYSSSSICSGYSDLHSGAQVEVYNEKQEVLVTGYLTQAAAPTASGTYSSVSVGMSYDFTIPDVPSGAKQYGVHVGNTNRGIIWADEAQASTIGFALSIGGS